MAIQRRAQDQPPAEPPAPWEETLEQLEQVMEPGSSVVWPTSRFSVETELQLVIAQQLRELVISLRTLAKHPLLRRLY